jgi:transcriptional regulator with XRE-family HTH domain
VGKGQGKSKRKAKPSIDPKQGFGPTLRHLRKRVGYTQEVLGHRAGLHPTTISLYERGKRKPGYEIIVRLVGALDVDASELLADTWVPPVIGKEGHFASPDPPGP